MSDKVIVAHLQNPDGGYIKLEGSFELVNRLLAPYLKDQRYIVNDIVPIGEVTTPALSQNTSVLNTVDNGSQPQIPSDLIPLYRKAKPENQSEEVLIIAYHIIHFQGMSDVTKEDFERGYTALRFIPVKAPKDMKGAVRNTVDRTPWLRNADRGRYAVTLVGEEHVIEMLKRQ